MWCKEDDVLKPAKKEMLEEKTGAELDVGVGGTGPWWSRGSRKSGTGTESHQKTLNPSLYWILHTDFNY